MPGQRRITESFELILKCYGGKFIMAISNYKDLVKVCVSLGLKKTETKKGVIYKGNANNKYCRISIHIHSLGRDMSTGIYNQYIKDLGFVSDEAFKKYLDSI